MATIAAILKTIFDFTQTVGDASWNTLKNKMATTAAILFLNVFISETTCFVWLPW